MAIPIVMPRLGDFMTEGLVAKWTKPSGEHVEQGEVLAEIESEKLNYELEATSAGILHWAVEEGATVDVDGVMAYLLEEGEVEVSSPVQDRASTGHANGATRASSGRRRSGVSRKPASRRSLIRGESGPNCHAWTARADSDCAATRHSQGHRKQYA